MIFHIVTYISKKPLRGAPTIGILEGWAWSLAPLLHAGDWLQQRRESVATGERGAGRYAKTALASQV